MKNFLFLSVLFSLNALCDSIAGIAAPLISEVFFNPATTKPVYSEYHNPHATTAIRTRFQHAYFNGGGVFTWTDKQIHPHIPSIGYHISNDFDPNAYTHMAIILYRVDGNHRLNYDQLNDDSIIDTIVFATGFDTSNPFNDKLPEWTDNVLPIGDYSRCARGLRNPSAFQPNRPRTFGTANDCPANVEGDPHFIQSVYDYKTNETINICYDIVGQSQQSIFILEDKLLNTKVYGILLDDYYMHQINIFHSDFKIIIDTKKIYLRKEKIEWDAKNVGKIFSFAGNDKVSLLNERSATFTIFNDKRQKITIYVKRSKNSFGVEHLDVGFESIDRRGERYAGLIGDVKKMNIERVNIIQENDKVILKINDRIIYGKERISMANKCIFVPIKDIFLSNSLEKYVRFYA